jgi:putative sigma-54 modulation protein
MKISYTGNWEAIPARQRAKLEARLQKLAKTLERRGEKEAHIVLTQQRFLHKVEVTVNAMGHALVGMATDADLATAAHMAFDKLEKQILKMGARWRDTTRVRDKEADGVKASATLEPAVTVSKKASANSGPKKKPIPKQIFRVNHAGGAQKPMTPEEAMLEIEASQDYLVYRDAKTDRVTVLMRRSDGNFDLIES